MNMKNFVITLAFCVCITATYSQSLTRKEARKIIQNTVNYLNQLDTISFLLLRGHDFSCADCTPQIETFKKEFSQLRLFLDTALNQNLRIRDMQIELLNSKNGSLTYNVKVWFKYSKNYYKGFGVFLSPVNDKLVISDKPETSFLIRR